MKITLTVSTSFGQTTVGLFQGETPLFETSGKAVAADKGSIDEVIETALRSSAKDLADIGEIIVDIGPGGTSSVRTGVAYCNALSYAMDIPIVPFSSLEMLLYQFGAVNPGTGYSVAKSLGGMLYVGEMQEGIFTLSYVKQEDFIHRLSNTTEETFLLGGAKYCHQLAKKAGTDASITVTEIAYVAAQAMLLRRNSGAVAVQKYPSLPIPLTEQNIVK